jgi:murein DD-endopeptidase MepM/ murein hydrolase activator NlpD
VDPLKPRSTVAQKAPGSEEGYSYIVKKGETLEEIARAHHTALGELADANRLKPPYAIKAGMRLIIPKTGTGGQTPAVLDNPTGKAVGKAGRGSLEWPVKGRVVVEFGEGKSPEENGIVIEAPEGTVVRAAAEGKVGHVGKLAALGNVVLLDHPNHLVTVYAHLKNVRASKGKPVAKGEILGTVGTSGRVEKPSLYFEVRSRTKPKDPLLFLEQSR